MHALRTLLLSCLVLPAGGWLGVGLEAGPGGAAVIVEVVPGSPASTAGLQPGDVFVSIDGVATRDLDAVAARLQELPAGSRVALEVRRGGATIALEATLVQPPATGELDERAPPAPVRTGRAAAPGDRPIAGAAAAPALEFADDARAALARAQRDGRAALVVFGAVWCAACQAQRRALEAPELAAALAEVATIWVDTDAQPALADEFGVRSLPHLFVLGAGGERQAAREGYQPPANIAAMLSSALGAGGPAAAAEPAADGRGAASADLAALRDEVRALRAEVAEVRTLLQKLLESRR